MLHFAKARAAFCTKRACRMIHARAAFCTSTCPERGAGGSGLAHALCDGTRCTRARGSQCGRCCTSFPACSYSSHIAHARPSPLSTCTTVYIRMYVTACIRRDVPCLPRFTAGEFLGPCIVCQAHVNSNAHVDAPRPPHARTPSPPPPLAPPPQSSPCLNINATAATSRP